MYIYVHGNDVYTIHIHIYIYTLIYFISMYIHHRYYTDAYMSKYIYMYFYVFLNIHNICTRCVCVYLDFDGYVDW